MAARWLAVPLAIDLAIAARAGSTSASRTAAPCAPPAGSARRSRTSRAIAPIWPHARAPDDVGLACVHAAARANVVYVRERDGSFTAYRRREREPAGARLVRLLSGAGDDGRLGAPPSTDAPTWFALRLDALALPAGSCGYALSPSAPPDGVELRSAAELLAELAPR